MDEIASMPYRREGCRPSREEWHIHRWIMGYEGEITLFDGEDHEECGEGDVPSYEECDKAWCVYHENCVETGEDPLGEYSVKRVYRQRQRWTAEVRRGIGGLYVRRARRGRAPWLSPEKLPDEVRGFLRLDPWYAQPQPAGRGSGRGSRILDAEWTTVEEMAKDCAGDFPCTSIRRGIGRFSGIIEVDVPRRPSAAQRDIRRIARQSAEAARICCRFWS